MSKESNAESRRRVFIFQFKHPVKREVVEGFTDRLQSTLQGEAVIVLESDVDFYVSGE